MGAPSLQSFGFDRVEIERRKQVFRDLWAGKALDHAPVLINVTNPKPKYPVREQFQNADKQLEEALLGAGLTWQLVPHSDAVPAMRPDVGCSCLATAFGAELYWGDDLNQTCGIKEPLLRDIEDAAKLPVPSPEGGQLKEGIERVGRFADAGGDFIGVSLLDMAGGLNVANDLLGGTQLYLTMHENPEALEALLDKIQDLFLATIALQIRAAGGESRITTTDFPDTWFPEGCKGHASDDISANISPSLYQRFSIPYHNRVFVKYGGGGLHNCGPNPCLAGYLSHTPPPRCIDVAWQYSLNDWAAIRKLCARRAFVVMLGFPQAHGEAVEAFRKVMEAMAPDVLVIPVISVSADDHPGELYRAMRPIAVEYAKRMNWGWSDPLRR
jgi:hypothetical protein